MIDADQTSDDEVAVESVIGGDNRDPQNNIQEDDTGAGGPAPEALQMEESSQTGDQPEPTSGAKRPLVESCSEVDIIRLQILANTKRKRLLAIKRTKYYKNLRMHLKCDLDTIIEVE